MFTPKFWKWISFFVVKLGNYYILPFHWDPINMKLIPMNDRYCTIIYSIHIGHMVVTAIYLIFEYTQNALKIKIGQYEATTLLYMYIVGYVTASIEGANMFYRRQQIAAMIFQLNRIYARVVRKF